MVIETIAAGAVAVLAPYFAKAGEAVAEKIGESFAEKAGALLQAIKRKFSGDTDAEQTLALAERKPDSKGLQTSLEEVLREKMEGDQDFATLVERLVTEAKQADTNQIVSGSRNDSRPDKARLHHRQRAAELGVVRRCYPLAMKNASIIIDRWLKRAEQVVTIYTILAGISGFGIGACFFGPLRGFYLALGTFGAVGALDVFHGHARTQLDKRRRSRDQGSHYFMAISEKNPRWKPKVIKEFTHDGLFFRTIGFNEFPVPITCTLPLCPACSSQLTERAKVSFPGRPRIQLYCECGFSRPSNQTLCELQHEAKHIGNVLTDSSDSQSLN